MFTRHNRVKQATSVAEVWCVLAGAGCTGTDDLAIEPGTAIGEQSAALGLLPDEQRIDVSPLVSESWLGHRVGASPGCWRFAGERTLAGPEDRYIEPVYTPGNAGPPDLHPGSFILGWRTLVAQAQPALNPRQYRSSHNRIMVQQYDKLYGSVS